MRYLRHLSFLAISFLVGELCAQTVPTVMVPVPTQALPPGGSATVDLRNYFGLPGVSGQIVQFDTVLGKINVELLSNAAPRNAANFLSYVQSGAYSGTFFHRSSTASSSGGAIAIVQGGGFRIPVVNGQVGSVPTPTPPPVIPLEANLPNTRGTLAAARTSDPNSASNQWYFNVQDNTSLLSPANTGGGYSVFARVLGNGMTVVDNIAAAPRFNAGGDFAELPLINYAGSGSIVDSNFISVDTIKTIPLYPGDGAKSVLAFSATSSAPAVAAVTVTGSSLAITVGASGSATITVIATDTNGSTAQTTFTVSIATTPPVFSSQPLSQTVAAGSTLVLAANASAGSTYQWQRNGSDIPGATNSTLVLSNIGAANVGSYASVATNSAGAASSSSASISVTAASPAVVGRLINLAIRTNAGTGAQTLIVGFAVGGAGTSGSKPLLVRGVGPGLAQFGVVGTLADPVATVYQSTTVVTGNDNWNNDPAISARAAQVGAFALPNSSLDAAVAFSPASTAYTVQVTGNNNGTGIALAEIYDATDAATITATTPRLVNVSARTQVGTGGNVLIAGFVIGGTTSKTVLIRAIGPTLTAFGVPGVLADPKLQLFSGATVIYENDDWAGDPQLTAAASAVGAFPLANASSKDAVLLVTLPPGNYTAQVSGVGDTTGVALVEVYDVP